VADNIEKFTETQANENDAIVSERKLVSYNIKDFLLLKFQPREFIVDPIIPTQGLVMLYAPRGIGKTFLSLSIACSAAMGVPILGWQAPKPRRVLYVDGEMSSQTMQERFKGILLGIGKEDFPDDGNIKIICAAMQDNCLDLSREEDQKLLEPHLENIDFLILDNISTLTSVKENEADSWLPMQKWLKKYSGLADPPRWKGRSSKRDFSKRRYSRHRDRPETPK
jgi:putative DNA primase/helicase